MFSAFGSVTRRPGDNEGYDHNFGLQVMDIGTGREHITAATGEVITGMSGADFLCAIMPSEHLDMPTKEDVVDGSYVTRIAAHAADLTWPGAQERGRAWNMRMARAREELDWEGQFRAAIIPPWQDRSNQESCSLHRQGNRT